jgi:putative membrane protein
MEKELQLKDLYDGFRDAKTIKAYKKIIDDDLKDYDGIINIMEVCGGHTHTIMKYGIPQLINKKINFIHGPGCPVCVMPKERIDSAYELSLQEDVILVTLGDMIKVPGSRGSLQNARSQGADVRFVYSPMECIKTTILSAVLTLDSESSYYRTVVRDTIKRRHPTTKKYPGIIILEIDGLAREIFEEAMLKGYMPTLSKWVRKDSHVVTEWETDLSSQTGASQAGILHGNNQDITAFRWVEKKHNNKIVTSTGFSDAPMIEKRISNGKGLLVDDGASRSNLFSGDTDNVVFTFSKIKNLKKFYNTTWYYVFSNPNRFPSIVILFFWEMILEIVSQITHWINNIQPRIRRGIAYIPTRAGSNVLLREITTETLIGDMLVGDIDIAYATYLGYDEIAHHSGIRDKDSFKCLKQLDKQFNRLEEASRYAKRPYKFVIQSDHGQGNGATFKQRYGISFENYVRSLLPEDMTMYSNMDSDEYYSRMFSPFKDTRNTIKNGLDNISNKTEDILEYITMKKVLRTETKKPEKSEVIVLASGNLAMIYLTQFEERLSYEKIKTLFPNLIPGLVKQEGIGFIMVDSYEYGPIAIGSKGVYYLKQNRIEGENPLKNYGENAVKHLLRSSGFKYTPDILVNSFYNPETEEICAFEELVGSHGGLGGTQTKPFILHPKEWEIEEPVVGAENVYKILKNEILKYRSYNNNNQYLNEK